MNICVYGASSNTIDNSYIEANLALGRLIAKQGHTVVFGGGACGMMGAVARGARSEGGDVLGISPAFFKVDGSLYDECTDFIYTETMRERKQLLEDRSDGFVISPGGVGTLDEFFEIFTLRQLSKHKKPIVIFNVNHYYDLLIKFLNECIEQNFMSERNRELFYVTDKQQDVIDYIVNYSPKDIKLTDLKDVK